MNKNKKGILKTLKTLINYIIKNNKGTFVIVTILAFITTAGEIASSVFIQTLIDSYIVPLINSTNVSFAPLISYLVKIGAIMLCGVIAYLISAELFGLLTEKVLYDLRRDCFEHTQELPISFFDTHSFGELMGVFTNDMDTISDVILSSIPDLFRFSITIVVIFVTMVIVSPLLSIFAVVYVAVILLVMKLLSKRSVKYFRGNQKTLAALNGYAEESLNAQKVIKTFCYEERNKATFEKLNEDWSFNSEKAHKYTNLYMPIMANISNLLYVILAVIGVRLAFSENFFLSVGTTIMFLQLSRSFTGSFINASNHINNVIRASAGAERIFAFLAEEKEVDNGTKELSDIKGDIVFKDVNFAYDGKHNVLHDISLWAKRGEKIAFVGSTGAGKTTITNLLDRFYDIDSGVITFDGIDIKEIKKSSLRGNIGLVLQDTHLFSGTIKENIRYGRLDATDEEIVAAAKLVGADSFIERLKDGYDTYINASDTELSMGQRQLLSIARAAVLNPSVMVLDEATSSIDSESEMIIQKGMDALMKGRTVLVIAHRLSTVQGSVAIMVMEGGKIIERGTHEDLLQYRGRYYDLYTGKLELD